MAPWQQCLGRWPGTSMEEMNALSGHNDYEFPVHTGSLFQSKTPSSTMHRSLGFVVICGPVSSAGLALPRSQHCILLESVSPPSSSYLLQEHELLEDKDKERVEFIFRFSSSGFLKRHRILCGEVQLKEHRRDGASCVQEVHIHIALLFYYLMSRYSLFVQETLSVYAVCIDILLGFEGAERAPVSSPKELKNSRTSTGRKPPAGGSRVAAGPLHMLIEDGNVGVLQPSMASPHYTGGCPPTINGLPTLHRWVSSNHQRPLHTTQVGVLQPSTASPHYTGGCPPTINGLSTLHRWVSSNHQRPLHTTQVGVLQPSTASPHYTGGCPPTINGLSTLHRWVSSNHQRPLHTTQVGVLQPSTASPHYTGGCPPTINGLSTLHRWVSSNHQRPLHTTQVGVLQPSTASPHYTGGCPPTINGLSTLHRWVSSNHQRPLHTTQVGVLQPSTASPHYTGGCPPTINSLSTLHRWVSSNHQRPLHTTQVGVLQPSAASPHYTGGCPPTINGLSPHSTGGCPPTINGLSPHSTGGCPPAINGLSPHSTGGCPPTYQRPLHTTQVGVLQPSTASPHTAQVGVLQPSTASPAQHSSGLAKGTPIGRYGVRLNSCSSVRILRNKKSVFPKPAWIPGIHYIPIGEKGGGDICDCSICKTKWQRELSTLSALQARGIVGYPEVSYDRSFLCGPRCSSENPSIGPPVATFYAAFRISFWARPFL
ncbi:PREDICTED: uncharacterized protein LOC108545142 [Rhinopithecus bieti]|uniref:uncharacterized protein LOC108545142 n=1 Tax=Rhinopithecus bieti TaxID=61621 RepID=UPI00083C6794|nr:PREDICTED: uncharacterized protein LOC108545142 [Rhinopithecus bieti]